jgi:hypothetical protein
METLISVALVLIFFLLVPVFQLFFFNNIMWSIYLIFLF